MDILQKLIKQKYEKDIVKKVEEYLDSKEGKKIIIKSIRNEIKEWIQSSTINEILGNKNSDIFYDIIEEIISKRFRLTVK